MKQIEKDELYTHLSQFLKNKGIELKEGSYTKGIHAGCSLLVDAINLSQAGLERAKTELDKQLTQVRQVIHEKTAPKVRPESTPRPNPTSGTSASGTGSRPRAGKTNASNAKVRQHKETGANRKHKRGGRP